MSQFCYSFTYGKDIMGMGWALNLQREGERERER